MRQQKLFRPIIFLSLLGIGLAGCNLPVPTFSAATKTPVIVFPTETSVFPATHPPSETPLPTATVTSIPASPTSTATATLVPTTTNTPTPLPTSTHTPNPRQSASATYLSRPPSIDGPWDDWSTTQYPLKHVVFRAANWNGPDDLQASYRVGWDSSYLYLAVKVFDDVYAQHASGANIYLGDSLEVLLSTNPGADSRALGLAAHDYQVGISPGYSDLGDDPEAYLWFPKAKEGKLTNVPIEAVSMKGGYRIEFAIPWSVFGITPARGQIYGFAISVSDNDNKDENLQQTMISNVGTRLLVDPSSWGLLTLK